MNLKAFYLSSGVYVPSRTLSLISLLFDKVYMLTLDPLSADIALRRGYELSDESKAAIKEMSKTVERFLQETEPLRQEGVLAVMPRNLRRDLKRMAKLLRKITHKIESDPNISATIGKRKISPVMSVELFPYLSFRRFALGSSETEERNSFVLQLDFNPRR